jgi:hypothetical protein
MLPTSDDRFSLPFGYNAFLRCPVCLDDTGLKLAAFVSKATVIVAPLDLRRLP